MVGAWQRTLQTLSIEFQYLHWMIDSKFCKIMNALWIIPLPQNLTENALKIGHPFPKGKDRCQITREQSYVWQKSSGNSSFSNCTFAGRGYVKLPRVTHCFQNTWNLDINSPEKWKKTWLFRVYTGLYYPVYGGFFNKPWNFRIPEP